MHPSFRTQLLKWSVAVLLAIMLVGGAALLYFGPVRGYTIRCDKAEQVSCVLTQQSATGSKSWQVPLGAGAVARVEVRELRRSGPQVLLYLHSATQSVFAAQFEGDNAAADAEAAAARLNQLFFSAGPGSVRLEVRPPSSMGLAIWAGFGFFALLSLVIFRELFKPEPRPDSSSEPTPLRGAA